MIVGSSFIVWGSTPVLDNLLSGLSEEIKNLAEGNPVLVFKSGEQIKNYKYFTKTTRKGVEKGLDIYNFVVGEVFAEFNVKRNDVLISRGFPRNIFQANNFENDHFHKGRKSIYIINVVNSFNYLESNFNNISNTAFIKRSKELQSVIKFLQIKPKNIIEVNGDQSEELIFKEMIDKLLKILK